MLCPKCKENVPRNNFCGNCGEKLLEKCSECGKMEPIGRKVCETKLEKAKQKLGKHLKNNIRYWIFYLGLFGGLPATALTAIGFSRFITTLFKINFNAMPDYQIIFCIVTPISIAAVLVFLLLVLLGYKKQKQAEQKATQEFLQKHPDYAEILRKAKE